MLYMLLQKVLPHLFIFGVIDLFLVDALADPAVLLLSSILQVVEA